MQVTVESLLTARSLQRPPYGVPPDNPYIIMLLVEAFYNSHLFTIAMATQMSLLLSKLDAYRTLLVSVSAYM